MHPVTTSLIKVSLSAMHYSSADRLLAPLTRGRGVIFTLHQVTPEPVKAFEPNRILRITPEFLESTIRHAIDAGFDIVSLDEAHHRLIEGEEGRPFACFTFDDGYRDNRDHALPIFRHYGLPMAIYVPTDYPDGHGELWWLALERALDQTHDLSFRVDGEERRYDLRTPQSKDKAFNDIYWWLRSIPEREARTVVRELCQRAGYDASGLGRELLMDWDELRQVAADPLVTIGAHTRSHFALAKLDYATARAEIEASVVRLEHELGRPCRHFSFPYGDAGSAGPREFELARELGLKTAVTTRKGLIKSRHAKELTGLPRLSLNGDFQDIRYIKVLMNGLPFAVGEAVSQLVPSRRPVSSMG